MATILIVEDELLIADEISRALTRLGHAPLEPVSNSDDVLRVVSDNVVDLVLMDINIDGDMDGIATALHLRRQHPVPVVFLTARSDAATLNRAKVAHPYGYLLKPFSDESLRAQLEVALYNAQQAPIHLPKALAAVLNDYAATNAHNPGSFDRYIFVKKGSQFVRVDVSDILFVESVQNYVRLHTSKEQFFFASTLKDMEQKLPKNFFKTHRSYLVCLDHVQAYDDGCLLVGKNEYVPVSRSSKDELKKRIHLLG